MEQIYIILLAIICWEIWKAKNLWTYEGIHISPVQACRNVKASLWSILQAFPFTQVAKENLSLVNSGLLPRLLRSSSKIPVAISWSPLVIDFVKLNTNGSSLGNPSFSSGGGIIRDPFENILVGFSAAVGIKTNMEVETLALLEGINLCLERGWQTQQPWCKC